MSKFTLQDMCLCFMKTTGETFSFSITLFVNSAIISGDLIHPVAYLKGIGEVLEVGSDGIANLLGRTMRERAEEIGEAKFQPKIEKIALIAANNIIQSSLAANLSCSHGGIFI
jgi:hypothetical protein